MLRYWTAGESHGKGLFALVDGFPAGVPLDAVRIGHIDGDLFDPRCTWLRRREIDAGGAILVRPDRFVAWRSLSGADDPTGELRTALSTVLARSLAAAVPA